MEGSVDTAIDMARAAHAAGADAIKVQLLKPETIARVDASKYWDDRFATSTQRSAFKLAGLIDYGAWIAVREACDEIGIEFFATPFDLAAVDALETIGVTRYKIASGDITYRQLIERVAQTGKGIVISTGASYLNEIHEAVKWCGSRRNPTLLACTLSYPSHAGIAHLARIETLRRAFPASPIGYSDHTSLTASAMCAAALGAQILEVHYTYDVTAENVPDHAMALDPEGLKAYVKGAEYGALLRGSGRLTPIAEEEAARFGARRSIVATRDIESGSLIAAEDLICLRPGDGVSPATIYGMIGHRAAKRYTANAPV